MGVYKRIWPPLGRDLSADTICRVLHPDHFNMLVTAGRVIDERFGYKMYEVVLPNSRYMPRDGYWEEDLEIVYERD